MTERVAPSGYFNYSASARERVTPSGFQNTPGDAVILGSLAKTFGNFTLQTTVTQTATVASATRTGTRGFVNNVRADVSRVTPWGFVNPGSAAQDVDTGRLTKSIGDFSLSTTAGPGSPSGSLGYAGLRGSGYDTTLSSVFSFYTTARCYAGNFVVLAVGYDLETSTTRVNGISTPGNASWNYITGNNGLRVYYAKLQEDLPPGYGFAINFVDASGDVEVTNKVAFLHEFSSIGEVSSITSAIGNFTGVGLGSIAVNNLASDKYVVYRVSKKTGNYNTTDITTSSSSWTGTLGVIGANSGIDNGTSIMLRGEVLVDTITQATSNPQWSVSGSVDSILAVFQASAGTGDKTGSLDKTIDNFRLATTVEVTLPAITAVPAKQRVSPRGFVNTSLTGNVSHSGPTGYVNDYYAETTDKELSLSKSIGEVTLEASGSLDLTYTGGRVNKSIGDITSSIVGGVTVRAVADVSIGLITLGAVGTRTVGRLDRDIGPITLSTTATISTPANTRLGSLTKTISNFTLSTSATLSTSSVPSRTHVRTGVTYGPEGSLTGTLVVPAPSDVKSGVSYGADGSEFTGSYEGAGGGGTDYAGPGYPHVADIRNL